MNKKPSILIALGGNALIQAGQKGTVEEQLANLKPAMETVVKLCNDYTVVLTHGNGPHVGNILLQQESCDSVAKMPMAAVGAMTQGQIGYLMEVALTDALGRAGITKNFATLVTNTIVDKDDPAFKKPTKPVGPFYNDKQQIEELKKIYPMVETPKGWRRVVASPQPLEICNFKEVNFLIQNDVIVISTGGGGIPVVRTDYGFIGIDAVIDKDLGSSLLAVQANIDSFVIATDEPNVCINYAKPDQTALSQMTLAEAKKYMEEGQFPAGSMGPKVKAAMSFVEKTGRTAIITSISKVDLALKGQAGTRIIP